MHYQEKFKKDSKSIDRNVIIITKSTTCNIITVLIQKYSPGFDCTHIQHHCRFQHYQLGNWMTYLQAIP